MNNLIKNNNTSIPNIGGVGTPPYVDKLALDVGLVNPTYFAVYPSKSSLTREDLSFGKIVHCNNFNLTETVHSPFTTHNSLKKSAFTLAEGATHVALCDKFCRVAFTLAEVLITLGIIGVVAALTLPSLIQRNIEKQRVVQLKKAYSELSQAYNLAVEEFGSPTEWGMGRMYEEKSHYIMASNMKKYLKLSEDCVDMPDSEAKRVCGQFNKIGKLASQNSIQSNTLKRNGRAVILSDGTTVTFRGFLVNAPFSLAQ